MIGPVRLVLVAGLLVFGLWQLGAGAQVHARAWLGQVLLERAWDRQERTGEPARPWPGAPTWPIARLHVPELELERMVLEGSDGASLAWGPGRIPASAPIDGHGHLVLAAHRDTHFRFLQRLEPGNRLHLATPAGKTRVWTVQGTSIVDSRETVLDLAPGRDRLSLVTCYPFDAPRAGGPLRFVVHLAPEDRADNIIL